MGWASSTDTVTSSTSVPGSTTSTTIADADFGTVLFFHELNVDPANPEWEERDFWHFSCGHVTPVIYSLMAERGYFPLKDLLGFRRNPTHPTPLSYSQGFRIFNY